MQISNEQKPLSKGSSQLRGSQYQCMFNNPKKESINEKLAMSILNSPNSFRSTVKTRQVLHKTQNMGNTSSCSQYQEHSTTPLEY